MKCCVCGAESGHYPLCRACNQKKEQGLIIKCTQCGQWHYADAPCPQPNAPEFLYECRKSLITANEQQFFKALKEIVPQGYHVFPQINLAAFIERVDNTPFRNELFRNVDFLITDAAFAPKIAVEINAPTHHDAVEGIKNVCLSLPTVLGKRGVHNVVTPVLNDEERKQLADSAKVMKEYSDKALEMISIK